MVARMKSIQNWCGIIVAVCTVVVFLLLYVFSESTSTSTVAQLGINKSTFRTQWYNVSQIKMMRNETHTFLNSSDKGTGRKRSNTYVEQPSNFNSGRTIIAGLNSSGDKVHTVLFYNPVSWFWSKTRAAMFHHCDYSNCLATKDSRFLKTASAIVFHFYSFGMVVQKPPLRPQYRNPDQAWVFMGRESPLHLGKSFRTKSWNNALNWSMTYRLTSDLYAGYGRLTRRTVLPTKDYDAIFQHKTKMAAWIVSHCITESKRDVFVADLQKYGVDVDVFGKCGKGAFSKRTDLTTMLRPYKFYLALENSFCKDYITEKFFGRYNFDLLLVTRGGADYNMLPAGTFINAGDFNGTRELARYLLSLADNREAYTEMLRRKDLYEAEAAVFGRTYGLCELCEKLNNLEQNRKTYSDVYGYLHNNQCWDPPDII